MVNEPNLAELAVAAWRLERWLDNLVAERKMAAKSSLRTIKKYLENSGVEIVDPLGMRFDPGLAIEVINNETELIEESNLIIIDTNSPIIKKDGRVIQYARVVLGTDVKGQKPNNEIMDSEIIIAQNEPTPPFQQTDANESSQDKIYIGKNDLYWIKKFSYKKNNSGYQAAIIVSSDIDTDILLLDEQVYLDYCRGISPRNPFIFKGKRGKSVVQIPYQDVWYMIVFPPVEHKCSEYQIEMYFEWIPNELEKEKESYSPSHEAEEKESEAKSNEIDTVQILLNETETGDSAVKRTDDNHNNEDVRISEYDADMSSPEKCNIMTEHDMEVLRHKNSVSYTRELLISSGALKQPYRKRKNKKHKGGGNGGRYNRNCCSILAT